jgi:hypothetical protein
MPSTGIGTLESRRAPAFLAAAASVAAAVGALLLRRHGEPEPIAVHAVASDD